MRWVLRLSVLLWSSRGAHEIIVLSLLPPRLLSRSTLQLKTHVGNPVLLHPCKPL